MNYIGGVLYWDHRDVRRPDFTGDKGFLFDLRVDAVVVVKVKPFTAGRKI